MGSEQAMGISVSGPAGWLGEPLEDTFRGGTELRFLDDTDGGCRDSERPTGFVGRCFLRATQSEPLPETATPQALIGAIRAGSRGNVPVGSDGLGRWAWLFPAFEALDDDHASATAGAWRAGIDRVFHDVSQRWWCHVEQFPGLRDACLAGRTGKQAVMPDPVEPAR